MSENSISGAIKAVYSLMESYVTPAVSVSPSLKSPKLPTTIAPFRELIGAALCIARKISLPDAALIVAKNIPNIGRN